jgi:hypothetical protein
MTSVKHRKIGDSIRRAGDHISALQDILTLSGSQQEAYKRALLSRLELQYALALLKIESPSRVIPPKIKERSIDLDRALARLSLHVAKALQLYNESDYAVCITELYAADALNGKIIPRLKKEK